MPGLSGAVGMVPGVVGPLQAVARPFWLPSDLQGTAGALAAPSTSDPGVPGPPCVARGLGISEGAPGDGPGGVGDVARGHQGGGLAFAQASVCRGGAL